MRLGGCWVRLGTAMAARRRGQAGAAAPGARRGAAGRSSAGSSAWWSRGGRGSMTRMFSSGMAFSAGALRAWWVGRGASDPAGGCGSVVEEALVWSVPWLWVCRLGGGFGFPGELGGSSSRGAGSRGLCGRHGGRFRPKGPAEEGLPAGDAAEVVGRRHGSAPAIFGVLPDLGTSIRPIGLRSGPVGVLPATRRRRPKLVYPLLRCC